jgi:putative alpha-1,2-mannosidase
MKVPMSTINIEGAKANHAAGVTHWDFDKVYADVKNEWNKYLSRVQVEGSLNDKVNFYTTLNHLYIQPNNIADVDGIYVGPNREITKSPTGKYYSTLSHWDTFRAAFPMYTILSSEIIDYLFTTKQESTGQLSNVTGLIGQYALGNEPSHHIAFLYRYLYRQHDTQRLIRQICRDFYQNKPDGLIGNEDCGQMSALYIYSAIGSYPVNTVGSQYIFGTPQLSKATINLDNDNSFVMEAINLSEENLYIEKIELNGELYTENFIKHDDIMNGAKLTFYMSIQ